MGPHVLKEYSPEKIEILHDKKCSENGTLRRLHSVVCFSNTSSDLWNARMLGKFGFAVAYALSSFLLMSVNKIVLTSWKFPSPTILVVGQILTSIIILYAAKQMKVAHFPDLTKGTFKKLHPLPILYLGNAVTGLGGTKELSLPMFTAVRRFAILMTMAGEYYVLGVKSPFGVQFSAFLMVAGSFIAAVSDVKFTMLGYALVMLNNCFTSVKGVVMKQKLDTTDFGACGIIFYNAIFTLVPAVAVAYAIGDIERATNYLHWTNLVFLIYFFLSCLLGLILIWSVVECTNHNSALTTAIVGTIKNILITYIGMFIGGDYVLEFYNFLGLNLSVFGSLVYIFVIYKAGCGNVSSVSIKSNSNT